MKYISLLRGINVGGKRKILMKDLKELYLTYQLNTIQTYIQSGNVLFESPSSINIKELSKAIQNDILEKYDFKVPVITFSLQILKNVINLNTFLQNDVSIDSLHLTILSDIPDKEKVELLTSPFNEDEFIIHQNFIFIKCKGKYSQSKLSNQYFEKKLGVEATTRNWKTVKKLVELHES